MEPGSGVSERGRESCTEREGERESCTQRTHLSSLSLTLSLSLDCSFVLSLLCFLLCFCFDCTETVAPPHPSLPHPPTSPSSGCFRSCHHQRTPPQVWIHGNEGPRHSGKESVRRGFNESEASSPGEKCMQIICTHQKGPWVGEASASRAPAELRGR